jgi:serine/threonine protein kinase
MPDATSGLETIVMAALEIQSPHERAAYLESACGGNAELRRRVDRLLQSHSQIGDFLERSPLLDLADELLADTSRGPEETQTSAAKSPAGTGDSRDLALALLAPCDKPDRIGSLGPYEIIEVVGRGGLGVVYRAWDPKLNRVVALKVPLPQFSSNATARQRFLREAQAAAAISNDHVVTIHAVDETGGIPYLVMEFVEGLSLQRRIDHQGPLELKEILRIGMQIASGLAAAQAHGLIHRDIKPSNILLENGIERVKITDFGLARAVDDVGMTQTGMVTGTPQYMSPEQARAEHVDHRSDLFSLGCVMYAMCAGRPPFRAETTYATLHRVCEDTPRALCDINPHIPDWLVEVIDRLLAKRPEDRFQTAAEVADVLGKYLAWLQSQNPLFIAPPVAPPASPTQLVSASKYKPPRSSRRSFWLSFTASLLVLALAGIVIIIKHKDGTETRLEVPQGSTVTIADTPRSESGDPEDAAQSDAASDQPRPNVEQRHAGAVKLFNGRDLSGWKGHPDAPGDWQVENGLLVGRGPTSYLFSERGDFADFHLWMTVKINGDGNAGLFLRSRFALQNDPLGGHPVPFGYETDISSHTGRLYVVNHQPSRKATGNGIATDDWFDLEVIARGNSITVKVNGETTAEFVDDERTFQRGHFVLQAFRETTTVHVRQVEIQELPLAQELSSTSIAAAPERGAFAVIGRAGTVEARCDTIAEAIAVAHSGDTIEVRGNGPFITSAVDVGTRSLTIRAGDGFSPVIRLSRVDTERGKVLLVSGGRLVLEGLEFQRLGPGGPATGWPSTISCRGSSLYVAHCRLVQTTRKECLVSSRAHTELRNCEIRMDGALLNYGFSTGGRLVVDNCLLAGGSIILRRGERDDTDGVVKFTGNTLVTQDALFVFAERFPKRPESPGETRVVRIEASGNVLAAPASIWRFEQSVHVSQQTALSPEDAVSFMSSELGWRGTQNVYDVGGALIDLSVNWRRIGSPWRGTGLADWREFWGSDEPGSAMGRVRFQGGVIRAKSAAELQQLVPEDFRLLPDSAGYRAGPDARDLGADIDLVGPGPAYCRWKTTQDYQQWLKTTGQPAADVDDPGANR